MMLLLPVLCLFALLPLFALRYSGIDTAAIYGWTVIQLIFLMKERTAHRLSDFRGVSLLAVTAKLYMS